MLPPTPRVFLVVLSIMTVRALPHQEDSNQSLSEGDHGHEVLCVCGSRTLPTTSAIRVIWWAAIGSPIKAASVSVLAAVKAIRAAHSFAPVGATAIPALGVWTASCVVITVCAIWAAITTPLSNHVTIIITARLFHLPRCH